MSKYNAFNMIYKNIFLKIDLKRRVWLIFRLHLYFPLFLSVPFLFRSRDAHHSVVCIQSLSILYLHLILVNCKSQAHPLWQSHRLGGFPDHPLACQISEAWEVLCSSVPSLLSRLITPQCSKP